MTRRSVARAALGMAGATAVSRAFGFVRVLVVAAILGTTYLGNTFQAANSVSNVLFELLAAGALSAVLVPTFVTHLDAGDDAAAKRLAGGVLGAALTLLVPVTVVATAASPWIARLLATGAPAADAGRQRELSTFLLVWFLPQLVLYALGAVATAWLYARRRFALTAAAPIGNTVVMIAGLVAFRLSAGAAPTLELATADKLWLAVAGTGGVLAYVGVLVAAAARAGFAPQPRAFGRDPAVRRLLGHAVWGVLLHANAGLLLGAAIVAGNGVAGGVVAYQVAFVFFLAPYAVLAQPLHTAILPELAADARSDLDGFARSVEWTLERMALVLVPVTAGLMALALPAMRVVTFGRAEETGPPLVAAALAALSAGLLPYAALLLFARAFYALGDSRTPALVAVGSGAVGVLVTVALAAVTDGAARVAALGAGHTVAYAVAAAVLGARLVTRIGRPLHVPVVRRALACAAPAGVVCWAAARAVDPAGRLAAAATVTVLAAAAAAGYAVAMRRWVGSRAVVGPPAHT
jgi:putative peptidoglycan lipid II flippase